MKWLKQLAYMCCLIFIVTGCGQVQKNEEKKALISEDDESEWVFTTTAQEESEQLKSIEDNKQELSQKDKNPESGLEKLTVEPKDNQTLEKKKEEVKEELKREPREISSVSEPVSLDTNTENEENILVIGPKMYLAQIEDIYYNFDNYKDKTIVIEGMYALFYNRDGLLCVPTVYRKGPGCCGNDGWGGFFMKYGGEYPEIDSWIKVTGTPELVIDGYFRELYLNVISIEVMPERGEEFVIQ